MNVLMRTLERVLKALNFVSIIAAILMTLFVFFSVVMRYLVGQPLRFSNEFVGLLFVTIAFLAIPLAQYRRRHIGVDLLTELMPNRLRLAANAAGALILIVFCVSFGAVSYVYMDFSIMLGARSEVGELVLWPWIALMPICAVALGLVALVQLYEAITLLFGRNARTSNQPGSNES